VDAENQYLHLKSLKLDVEGQLNISSQERVFAQERATHMETMCKRKDEYIKELEC
jgi:hypothetical protein